MKIAVITGASSGMGREFVFQLDACHDFDEIWVIARRLDRLEELKGKTRAQIRPISLDLTKKESIETYGKMLEEEKPDVYISCAVGIVDIVFHRCSVDCAFNFAQRNGIFVFNADCFCFGVDRHALLLAVFFKTCGK